MLPHTRLASAVGAGLSPFLFCNEIAVAADGAPLACPECAGPNLHLDTVHFATPTDEHYTPTLSLRIDPDTGSVLADDQAACYTPGRTVVRCWPSAIGARKAAAVALSCASKKATGSAAFATIGTRHPTMSRK
jgi:hypothetical protein